MRSSFDQRAGNANLNPIDETDMRDARTTDKLFTKKKISIAGPAASRSQTRRRGTKVPAVARVTR
jgi:hypothetical protein